ncbi:hypothetical protein DFH06DRAFT_1140476 [Mycena polygramma]|nr:hypothetical protein DFH06DRAFT_1140476 [Mycena polygramma]
MNVDRRPPSLIHCREYWDYDCLELHSRLQAYAMAWRQLNLHSLEFDKAQQAFGKKVIAYVLGNPAAFLKAPGDGVTNNGPETDSKGVPPPGTQQMANLRNDKVASLRAILTPSDWLVYDSVAPYDVITGSLPLSAKGEVDQAKAKSFGLPPIT